MQLMSLRKYSKVLQKYNTSLIIVHLEEWELKAALGACITYV